MVTAGRDDLNAALRKVEPLLGDRPERRYLRIDAGDALSFSTTDRDQLVTAQVAADVAQTGSVIAYGRFLVEFVRRASPGKIVLRFTASELRAEASEAYIALSVFPDDVWPRFEHLQGDGVTWSPEVLRQLRRVLHAVSLDTARPALQGVCFRDGWAAATDGHQIAAVRLELPEATDMVIPAAALEHVLRLAGDEGVEVRFAERRVSFGGHDAAVSTTLLARSFPDWQQAVPPITPTAIRTERRSLLAVLERIAFLTQRDDHCRLYIHPDGGALRLEATLADIGHQEERIPGENTVGDVCLQARHLRNLLEQLTGATVTLSMDGPLAPAVAREDGYIGLLMPIRA